MSWYRGTWSNMISKRRMKWRLTAQFAWTSWLSLVCFLADIDSAFNVSDSISTTQKSALFAGRLFQNSSKTNTTMPILITSSKRSSKGSSLLRWSRNFRTFWKRIWIWKMHLFLPLKLGSISWDTRTLKKCMTMSKGSRRQNGQSPFSARIQVIILLFLNSSILLSSMCRSR